MEELGVENVRAKLAYGHTARELDAPVSDIVDKPPHPNRRFVEAWLAEKDAAERKQRVWTLICAAVAAATGIIAVLLGIVTWLLPMHK
jgi:hypothetical protein